MLFDYPWAGVGIGLALWVAVVYVVASIGKRTQPLASAEQGIVGGRNAEADPAQLTYENEQLRKQDEKATSELSLPANVAVERRIANRDFRIHDLLKLAGTDSTIEGKEFENCTIRGPATITTTPPPRPPEKTRGSIATAQVFHPSTLYVEGDPDSVLQEVPSGGATASGIIHLVGCSFKRVTFSSIAIAGNTDELDWWRENATFSRGRAAPHVPSQEPTIELGDTARLFLMDGSIFKPDDDEERRSIFFPHS